MPRAFVIALVLGFLLPGMAWAQDGLGVTSASIVDGKLGKPHACSRHGGRNVSPEISVTGLPDGTTHLAIVMDDPDAMAPAGKVWVHWNVVNIPASQTAFPAGQKPPGKELHHSGGGTSYAGMCPPDGVHEYRIAVFALNGEIDAGGFFGPSELTIERFADKYAGKILARGMVTGRF